ALFFATPEVGPDRGYDSYGERVIDNFCQFLLIGLALMAQSLASQSSYAREREKVRDYAAVVERTNAELCDALEENRLLAHTDSLTALPNRRYLEPLLAQRIDEANRYHRPVALCVLDIDHFKTVNDTYGHATGDATLALIAQVIRDTIRDSDLAARWGGEEFVILCPETDADGGYQLAQRVRAAVAAARTDDGLGVTISVGVAAHLAHADAERLFERADAALYRAKREGRNRVVVDRAQPRSRSSASATIAGRHRADGKTQRSIAS
ncbi:MAG: GGDEF domain-containing protein, partial [Myxococcota bacterium]